MSEGDLTVLRLATIYNQTRRNGHTSTLVAGVDANAWPDRIGTIIVSSMMHARHLTHEYQYLVDAGRLQFLPISQIGVRGHAWPHRGPVLFDNSAVMSAAREVDLAIRRGLDEKDLNLVKQWAEQDRIEAELEMALEENNQLRARINALEGQLRKEQDK